MLTAAISRDVMTWLDDRRARRRSTLLASGSIAVAVLLAIGGFLINQLLLGQVRTAVNAAIQDKLASVTFQSRVAALNFRALRLDQADGFTQDDANDLVLSVASLYESSIDDTDLPEETRLQNILDLTFAVETIANSFAQADRDDLISEITDAAPEVTGRSVTMTQLIVQMMGRNLIGTAGGTDSWVDDTGAEQELYREYKEYAERARRTGFPELYLVFELITRHMAGRPDAEMRELIADITDLNEVDREGFERLMRTLVEGSFIRSPTAASRRIQARTRAFLEDYGTASPFLGFVLATVADPDAEIQDAIPVALGQTEGYAFQPEGRPGWHQLSVDQASAYRIDVMSSDGDPIIDIRGSDDLSTPLSSDDDGGVGTDARLEVFLEAGVYYLTVRDLNGETGSFSLLVQLLTP